MIPAFRFLEHGEVIVELLLVLNAVRKYAELRIFFRRFVVSARRRW